MQRESSGSKRTSKSPQLFANMESAPLSFMRDDAETNWRKNLDHQTIEDQNSEQHDDRAKNPPKQHQRQRRALRNQ